MNLQDTGTCGFMGTEATVLFAVCRIFAGMADPLCVTTEVVRDRFKFRPTNYSDLAPWMPHTPQPIPLL